jgi:hypothetical protein
VVISQPLPPQATASTGPDWTYLPSSLHVCRALDVIEVQNKSSQGQAEPAEPQQSHQHHPSVTQDYFRFPAVYGSPKLSCSQPTAQLSQSRTEQVVCNRFFWEKMSRSDQQVPSETIYRQIYPSCLSSPFPLVSFLFTSHRLQQIPSNLWSIVQNKDSVEGDKRQGHSSFSSRVESLLIIAYQS